MSQALPLITRQGDRIAIVTGLRTPFARQATAFHGVPAIDLGKMVVGEMLARSDIPAEVIEQLVFGQVVQMPEAPNIAREIVLGTGMSVHTDAYSVSRACATSFQAVANVAESLMAGTIRAGIAGVGQIDKSLDEASLSLRAGSLRTITHILLPLLRPAILSALIYSFVRAITTVSAIVFLVTPDTRVATAYILDRVEDGEYGVAIAYGSILIVVMLAIIFIFYWLIGEARISRSKAKNQA